MNKRFISFMLAIIIALSVFTTLFSVSVSASDGGESIFRFTSHRDNSVIDSSSPITITWSSVPLTDHYVLVIKDTVTDVKILEEVVFATSYTIRPNTLQLVEGRIYKIYGCAQDGDNRVLSNAEVGQICEWEAIYVTASYSNQQSETDSHHTLFRQTDPRWADIYYGYRDQACTQPTDLGYSGCGVLSLVNAIYYLTDEFIDPEELADYSISNGHRIDGVGTKASLYSFYANDYGSTYGFQYGFYYDDSNIVSRLKRELQKGAVAIVSVPNHLLAVVDYDGNTEEFLVLDSYPSSNRGTSSNGDWISAKKFTEGSLKAKYMVTLFHGDGEGEDDYEEDSPQGEISCSFPSIVTANPNTAIKLPLYIEENTGAAYIKCRVETDLPFHLEAGKTLAQSYLDEDGVGIFYQSENSTQTGVLCNVVVQIPEDASHGEKFTVSFVIEECFDTDEIPVSIHDTLLSSITIEQFVPGDVNTDRVCDGRDLLALLRHVASGDEFSNSFDVNEDGTCNGLDVLRLLALLAAE